MTKITYKTVGVELIRKVPEFKDVFNEYLKDQHGENLPHVLFGDFTRFVIKQYSDSQKNEEAKDVFLRCIEFVEDLLVAKDKKLRNLVAASFLENLHEPGGDYYRLIKLMTPYFKPKTLELLKFGESS